MAIVLDHQHYSRVMNLDAQQNLVDCRIVVTILEGIGDHLLDRQVGDVTRLLADATRFDELHRLLRDAA